MPADRTFVYIERDDSTRRSIDPDEEFEAFKRQALDGLDIEIRRGRLEPGRSFSRPAMVDLVESVNRFIGACVASRWERTGEPPSVLKVRIEVEVH